MGYNRNIKQIMKIKLNAPIEIVSRYTTRIDDNFFTETILYKKNNSYKQPDINKLKDKGNEIR